MCGSRPIPSKKLNTLHGKLLSPISLTSDNGANDTDILHTNTDTLSTEEQLQLERRGKKQMEAKLGYTMISEALAYLASRQVIEVHSDGGVDK